MDDRHGAPRLRRRAWVPSPSEDRVARLARRTAAGDVDVLDAWIHDLVGENHRIHVTDAVNLNPAANTMNPRAEALLASGLGSRPSLG